MKKRDNTADLTTWVTIDVAKRKHVVLIESDDGKRHQMVISNTRDDFERLLDLLNRTHGSKMVALEPTADYHRPIGFYLSIMPVLLKDSPNFPATP